MNKLPIAYFCEGFMPHRNRAIVAINKLDPFLPSIKIQSWKGVGTRSWNE